MTSLEPGGFGDLVDQIGVEVRTTRLRAARAANTELVAMNWRIGRLILDRQQTEPWGSGVIRRLAAELRREFPDMKGLSATNLQYMRAFAAAWPDTDAISQRPVGKLPWGHVCTLLDQLDDPDLRDWYAERDAGNSWSRPVLEHHIGTGLHRRIGAAPSNFADHLEPVDADQAQEIVKDPYVFDFLDLTERSRERAIETALTERLQDTLAELGPGLRLRRPAGPLRRRRRRVLRRPAAVPRRAGPLRRGRAQGRPVPARDRRAARLLRHRRRRPTPPPHPARPHRRDPAVQRERQGTASSATPSGRRTPRWPSPPTPTTPSPPQSRPRSHRSRRSPRRSPAPGTSPVTAQITGGGVVNKDPATPRAAKSPAGPDASAGAGAGSVPDGD